MARTLLIRGMVVGVLAGVVALIFARIFGEPAVSSAIALESARAQAAGLIPGPELVSRRIQSTLGLGTAVVVYGATIGGIFALVYAVAQGRMGALGARATAAVVAAVGFVSAVLVPFLKYPANPPSVGHPDTIGHRSGLYFTLLVTSVLLAVAAVYLGRLLMPRLGGWDAGIVAAAAYVAAVATAAGLLPGVHEVPPGFPADLLWRFRVASLGTQAVLWTSIGLLFGALTERGLRHTEESSVPVATP